MRKLDFCLCENKGADQLCSNYKADQRLCLRYTDSTIRLLSKSGISVSSHLLCLYSSVASVCVAPGRKPPKTGFPHISAQMIVDISVVSLTVYRENIGYEQFLKMMDTCWQSHCRQMVRDF